LEAFSVPSNSPDLTLTYADLVGILNMLEAGKVIHDSGIEKGGDI
jgi:hypothetical protein